jgi:hypothetical protein
VATLGAYAADDVSREELTAVRAMVKSEAAAANTQGSIKAGEKPLQ